MPRNPSDDWMPEPGAWATATVAAHRTTAAAAQNHAGPVRMWS